uniref:Ring finger protein 145 n=1 Tax=Molossus molossus TaxID=27622 RepID=A0A7J8ICQ8_MOLMO|nr:ring finger protein 145 [Molossus molossus]
MYFSLVELEVSHHPWRFRQSDASCGEVESQGMASDSLEIISMNVEEVLSHFEMEYPITFQMRTCQTEVISLSGITPAKFPLTRLDQPPWI